jgi:hypothetical protein
MTVNDTGPAVTTDPPEPEIDEATARRAAALILAKGLTPEGIRKYAARRSDAEFRGMFLLIAAAMDALLSEGFDPVAYKESLKSGDGAPVTGVPAQSPAEEG